jgi:geranylgeranyl pyrophosphate synthase
MLDPELQRRNMQLGWAIFGLAMLLFAGTFTVALIYIALSR